MLLDVDRFIQLWFFANERDVMFKFEDVSIAKRPPSRERDVYLRRMLHTIQKKLANRNNVERGQVYIFPCY